ncbi:uncharacterized protein APUU_30772S [Aspergillus puulaauensis]|uniref:Major facilitator superfamily domain-containing protein n=1 Tax=Aspergillus puulaauensis TaxID=1220207 RepID=A0A7R7XJS5_9EURO|nr:uncharacterized protein APUU_30772S [Aspergillus puulaauensis]BCS22547.1 hypothetical protein APUU_30772S [Aspergillus puulaauensis]
MAVQGRESNSQSCTPGPKDSTNAEAAQHVELVKSDGACKTDIDKFGSYDKIDPLEIKLVRKLDMWIMPTLWVMYFLNFLDRNAMVNGKLDTLSEDLGLVGSQYNTCVSILFVGYLGGQVPSNMLLSRVRPSWYMAGMHNGVTVTEKWWANPDMQDS